MNTERSLKQTEQLVGQFFPAQEPDAKQINTGFYLAGMWAEEALDRYKLEEFPEDSLHDKDSLLNNAGANYLLKGSCQRFALALHEHFGYPVYEIIDLSYSNGRLVHAFCVAHCNEVMLMIDVRGITTCFELFIQPFGDPFKVLASDHFIVRERDLSVDYLDNEEDGSDESITAAQADALSKAIIEDWLSIRGHQQGPYSLCAGALS